MEKMKHSETSENRIGQFFDRLYRTRQNRSMRSAEAYPIYLDLLQAGPGDTLLDIGCGPGWLLKAGRERGVKCVGMDLSPAAIRLAQKNAPTALGLVGSVMNLPFRANQFSLVSCIGVFEHFLDPEQAAREMRRVAGDNARFCLLVPNSRTFSWKLSEWFGSWNEEANENARSLEEWRKMLQGVGFTVLAVHRDWWQVRRIVGVFGIQVEGRLYRHICKILEKLIPLKFAHQFIFILKNERKSSSPA